jgi:anti-sigma B factor antagonist
MAIEFEQLEQVTVVKVRTRRLDAATAPTLKSKVGQKLEQGVRKVVMDLSEVELLDSTGLGSLLSLLKRIPPGGGFVLSGCAPSVMELMKLTRLDRVLQFYPDAASAAKALSTAI